MGRKVYCNVFNLDNIEKRLKAGNEASVQFDTPFRDLLQLVDPNEHDLEKWQLIPSGPYLERLDAMCAKWGDRLRVRFYDYWGQPFDAAIVERLPNIRNLSADWLWDAKNLDAIGKLKHLTRLHLEIYNLEDKAILGKLPIAQLEEVILSPSNTKALDLAPLSEATKLRRLYLAGHHKNVASLAALNGLQEFTFSAKKGLDLSFINGMRGLEALKFNLGGIESIEAIELPELSDLSFTMVRGLTELGDMQRFPGLRRLLIQDQQQAERVRFGSANQSLEHLWFYNCKKLAEIEGLDHCDRLKSLRWLFTDKNPNDLKLPRSLTHLLLLSGRRKEEAQEIAAIEAMGYITDDHPEGYFFYK